MKNGKLVRCKPKFNPYTKSLIMNSGGFPDFVAIKFIREGIYDIIGVEVKMNGSLSREEKEKCRWLLEKNIFSQILIAKKSDKRGEVEYVDFKERYWK